MNGLAVAVTALVASHPLAVHQVRPALTAGLAHLPLILARDVEAGGTAEPVLLEPDPAGVAVRGAVLRVPPEGGLLRLARGAGLGFRRSA